jgi:hypothetical protein
VSKLNFSPVFFVRHFVLATRKLTDIMGDIDGENFVVP